MEVGEPVSTPDAAPPVQEEKPRIVKVEILQDDHRVAGGGKQFTNLSKDAKWVDGSHVLNIARLGFKLRIKVTFDKPGAHNFKLKFLPGTNSVYTGGEKGRNPHFKYQEDEKSYTTGGDGTKVIEDDFFVAAAGGDTYQVTAKDDAGNQVTSGILHTQRLAWVVELKMRGLRSVASNINSLINEFHFNNLKLVALPAVQMEHMTNVSDVDEPAFLTKARVAYQGSTAPAKAPYVIAIAYTDHLAVKDPDEEISTPAPVDVGPGRSDVEIEVADGSNGKQYLWHDLVPGEGWFVSAKFVSIAGVETAIAQADCAPMPEAGNPNLWSKVKVKVSGLPASRGKITLEVNWVNRMRAGISCHGNIVCACTRAWWCDIDTAEQNQVMIHEIGHQLAMVADGSGKGPDKVVTHYFGKGHIGPHCHEGLPILPSYRGQAGNCVMFGETNGKDSFCSNCAPAVRKQDLSAGWSPF